MHTQVLRINYNHCKDYFTSDYLNYKEALDRCVLATLLYIDRVKQKLPNLHFEDCALQHQWVALSQTAHHEGMIVQLGIGAYRHHLDDLHEQLEFFIERKHNRKARVVYVSLFLDATYHLCVQFRSF